MVNFFSLQVFRAFLLSSPLLKPFRAANDIPREEAEDGASGDRAHQTVEINSFRPLSSADGATSISFLFCHANALADDKGGSSRSRNSRRAEFDGRVAARLLFCHTNALKNDNGGSFSQEK